uniref:Uncharacterized protein n=1 Tax=Rhodnius prolixus TaxID=13249 RepID=T1HTE4_RHOPR
MKIDIPGEGVALKIRLDPRGLRKKKVIVLHLADIFLFNLFGHNFLKNYLEITNFRNKLKRYEKALSFTKRIIYKLAVTKYVVLTTSGGIMDHEEARRKHLGGKILGFFF